MITDSYKRQHKEILDTGAKLDALLKAPKLDGKSVRTVLSTLAGQVTMHLAMEDKSLYPRLKSSKNPTTVSTAKQFVDKMGGLVDAFVAYNKKYGDPKTIEGNAVDFAKESRFVMSALAQRIQQEESSLYPLAEKEN